MLEALGLSTVEARVYEALVRLRSATPAELCADLDLRADQAAEAYGTLSAKGLLTMTGGRFGRLIASPPDIAGELLLLRRMEELQSARGTLGRLTEEYRTAPRDDSLEELIEITPGEAVAQRFEQLQRQAQTEVLLIDAPPHVVDQNTTEFELLDAGVRYRTLYDRRSLEAPDAIDDVRRYVAAGECARVLGRAPLKMIIVDRTTALVPISSGIAGSAGMGGPASSRSGSAVIHPCPVLDALIALFEMLWLCALPLDTVVSSGSRYAGLPEEDARLLTLLLSGMTDEAISRQLRVGRRTVVRRVRSLMDRAGASTRMQLGWQAAQLGWITAPWKGDGLRLEDLPFASARPRVPAPASPQMNRLIG